MDAKLKAKELMDKFQFQREDGHADYVAKQCALISIQESIEVLKSVIGSEKHMWSMHESDVMFELEKTKEEIATL